MKRSLLHHSRESARASLGIIFVIALALSLILCGCEVEADAAGVETPATEAAPSAPIEEAPLEEPVREALDAFDVSLVPDYAGEPSVQVNGNVPFFTELELMRTEGRSFASLDSLGRCGTVWMVVTPSTMPTAERGSIGMVKPSGWHTVRYEWVDGEYLYNRCHLLGYQLSGENANELNLITGTRSMNIQGMLPFEDEVASYVRRTGQSVLLRVTPVFEGGNLLASGVLMEAQSLGGPGLAFCVWCYNVEPGVLIDYSTGESSVAPSAPALVAGEVTGSGVASGSGASADNEMVRAYVLNGNSHKFHYPDCKGVAQMKAKNRTDVEARRSDLIAQGYDPCGLCCP